MKNKIIISIFIILSAFLITGCNSKKNKISNETNTNKTEEKVNNRSVVLYFSATGTTKKIAERIANESNSDIIEIIPKEKYKSEDFKL